MPNRFFPIGGQFVETRKTFSAREPLRETLEQAEPLYLM
jgi:hypothetical protein